MAIRTPRYLHKPMKFIFFETDDIVFGYMVSTPMLVLSALLGLPMPVTIIVIVGAILAYQHYKKKNNRGFLKHIGYMTGGNKFKGFVSSKVKKFRE